MTDNIIQIRNSNPDSELLGEGMSYLAEACARFMEIKAPEGHTIFRMTDSILHYIENYLIDDELSYLPKPTNNWSKELINA